MATLDDFKKIELKVAEIISAEPHPNADRLFVLKIKIGEELRQIVAGIRQYYTAEELPGKKIVVVANLEPALIRGVESQVMMLAASDGTALSVVSPERAIASGGQVR